MLGLLPLPGNQYNLVWSLDPHLYEQLISTTDTEFLKELNDHLEAMTQIAQKIDNENRELVKKNQELDIQKKSQEKDNRL